MSSRSGAAEDHVEAVGDVPVTVSDGNRAAGRGNHPGLTVFGGEPRREVNSFTGLQQTAPGAQDAARTPARYSMAGPVIYKLNMGHEPDQMNHIYYPGLPQTVCR